MKRYIQFSALLYCTLLLNTVLWWIRNEEEYILQPLDTYKLKTTANTIKVTVANSRTDTKSVGHKPLRGIQWHWKYSLKDTYMLKLNKSEEICGKTFIGYNKDFAKLENVVIDPSKGKGRRGGENISEVLNQKEQDEYFVLEPGYFHVQCQKHENFNFTSRSHLNSWHDAVAIGAMPSYGEVIPGWTIAVIRYEYVNLYHTMTDFYNTFLVAKVFNITQGHMTILWLDGHPWCGLDSTWETLFGKVLRAGDIKRPCLFEHMVWGIMGYHSPLTRHAAFSAPYLEEFRKYFLISHGITKTSVLNCRRLKITVIWRRDYLAHPRKPSGLVTRKIKNEEEFLEKIKSTFLGHDIRGVQIDLYNMTEQLKMIVDTDILVGMHGAGLTHVLFLPKHAGVVELCPSYWKKDKKHFVTFARWRKIPHLLWYNKDRKREIMRHSTIVDVDSVTNLIVNMNSTICGESSKHSQRRDKLHN
jgi:glycoprotein 2-beta-D-xylosyltransferase